MASWKGQSKGSVLGYRIFFFTLRTFGIRGAYALLRFVGFYYFLFAREVYRVQHAYFQKVHGYKGFKAFWAVYRNIVQFGQTLIDKAVVMSGNIDDPFEVTREGEGLIDKALEKGQGVLLISAHVGNWEAAGQMLNRYNTTVNLVMMDLEHQRLKQYLQGVMSKRKLNVITIGNDLSHLVAIKQAFARNEIVALHGDRFVKGQRTAEIPFFSETATFPLGPFLLSSKLRVPTLCVFCMKKSDLKYHFYAYESGGPEITPEEQLTHFVSLLRRKVEQYPYQWYNYYDFWASK
jgi:predicted LPLAT superfamily acyltransferase